MQEYAEIKEVIKDEFLFFNLENFYEIFFEDVIITSQIIDLPLICKSVGLKEKMLYILYR